MLGARLFCFVAMVLACASALQGAVLRATPTASRSRTIEMASPPPPSKGGFGFDLFPPPPPPGAKPPAPSNPFADFQKNQAAMYGDLAAKSGIAGGKKPAKKVAKKAATPAQKVSASESDGPDLALVLGAFAVLALAAVAAQGGA